ncbi:MAG TPA: hypothetical protein VMV40_08120 [Acidiferrobacter sp.]|nr:hypothetical protein [Acidiferrobacter sp.]
MTRLKAFGIHLSLTSAALLVVFIIMRFFWYPYPFLAADGGRQTFWLLAGVTLTLGPLLTLLVFRSGKKGLRFDLAVIGVLQVVGFAFCVQALYARRIQLVVYSQGAFYGLDATRIALIGAKGQALLAKLPKRPAYVFVKLPHSKAAMLGVEIRTLRGEPPIYLRGWRYRPYTVKEQGIVLAHGFPMVALAKTNHVAAAALARFRYLHPHLSHYTFVPFHGTYESVILALNHANGKVAGVLSYDPGVMGAH